MPPLKKIIVLSVAFLFLINCQEDPTKMDKRYLISRSKFVNILVDMYVMDAMVDGSEFYQKYEKNDSINIYHDIFKKYKVSKADFDSTVVSYTRRPDLYMKVYDDVILRLNLAMDKLHDNEPSFEKAEEK